MSTDFNIIHLRNTRSYDPDGSYVSTGRVFTAGTNGKQLWTNDLNLNNLSVSTLTLQSSLTVTNMVVQSTLTTSTLLTGTATFSQKSQFNTGVSIKGSPAGSWDVVTEYTDIDYQNLIFSDSTSPTKVITFRGNSGKIACSGLTASKILISDQYQTITASGVDSIKVTYLDNVSSDIQTQLNSKLNLSGGNLTGALDMGSNKITSTYSPVNGPDLTNKTFVDTADALKANLSGGNSFSGSQNYSDKTLNSVAIFDGSKNLTSSAISTTELNYVSGVTSAIQTQLNTKAPTSYVNDADALRVAKTGDTMTGNLLMGANSVTSTADPTTNDQLSRKGYVDTADGLRVLKSGDTMGGQLSVYNETSDIDSRYTLNTFLRGWSSFDAGSEADLTYTVSSSGSVGSQVVRTDKYVRANGPKIRLDKLKTYQVEFNIRRVNASSTSGATFYMVIKEYTWNGVNISGDGIDWYYAVNGIAQSSLTAPVWYNYKASVGPNGGKAHASNAFFISVGFITNYAYPANPDTIEMSGFKIYPIEDDIRSILTVSGITGKEGIFNTGNTAADATLALTLRDNTTIPHRLFFTPNLLAGNYNANILAGDFGIFTNYNDGPTGSNAIALGPWNGTNLVRITPTNTQFYGNVGIGLTNPSYKLDVNGDVNISGNMLCKSWGRTTDYRAGIKPSNQNGNSMGFYLGTHTNNDSGSFSDLLCLNSWTDGSGGDTNLISFKKSGKGIRQFQNAYGSGSNFSTYYDCVMTNGNSANVSFSGNVGIGTTNPSCALDVRETINTGAFTSPTFQVLGSTSYDGSVITNFQCQASEYGRNIVYMTGRFEGGNDGWYFGANARNAIIFRTQSTLNSAYTNRWTIQNYAGALGFLSAGGADVPRMVLLDNGNVGIGQSNPQWKLHVSNTNAWNDGGYLKADGIIGVGGKDNNPDYQYVVFPNPSQFDAGVAGMYWWSADMLTGRYKNEFRVAWWKETHGAPAGSAYKEGITMFLTDSGGYVNLDYIKLNGNTRVNGDISLGKFGNPGTGGTAFGDERSRYSMNFAGYRDVLSNRLGAKISVVNRVGSDGTNMNMSDLTFATTPNAVYGEDATVERMVIKANGNVGIGTTDPAAVLHISSTTADFNNTLLIETPWPSIRLKNSTSDWVVINGGPGAGIGIGNFGIYDRTLGLYRLSINTGGQVSIDGNVIIGSDLNVSGNITTTGDETAANFITNGFYRIGTSSGSLYWSIYDRGICSPEYALNNYGTVSTIGTGRGDWAGYGLRDRYCLMMYKTGTEWGIHDNLSSWLIFGTGGANRDVTIGGGVAKFDRSGDRVQFYANAANTAGGYFYYNSGNNYGTISDRRIKKDFLPITEQESIAFIKCLEPTSFCLKKSECKTVLADGTETDDVSNVCCDRQDGWVAQNVLLACEISGASKSIINHWSEYENELKLPEEERTTLIGVSDRPILSHAVNVIKILLDRVNILENKNQELENKNQQLESKINELENIILKHNSLLSEIVGKLNNLV